MDHSDPLRTLFADDFVFHQPGRNPTSGDYQGLDAVLGLLRTLGERSGGMGDRQARGHDRGRPGVHVWHVRDGKLAEAWAHPTDQHLLDEFWPRHAD